MGAFDFARRTGGQDNGARALRSAACERPFRTRGHVPSWKRRDLFGGFQILRLQPGIPQIFLM